MQDLQSIVSEEVVVPLKPGEYRIPTMNNGEVVGQIRCSRPGLRLIDFYRTGFVLAKDVPPYVKPTHNDYVEKQG